MSVYRFEDVHNFYSGFCAVPVFSSPLFIVIRLILKQKMGIVIYHELIFF